MAKKQSAAEVLRPVEEPLKQQDIPDRSKEIAEAQDRRNNERLERLNAIADHADSERELQETDGEQVFDPEGIEAKARQEDEEAQAYAKKLQEEGIERPDPEEGEEEEDSDTRVTNGVTYYRQIVNGKEKWQTLKELRETASKIEAADEYLQTASEAVRNASRLALSHEDESGKVEEVDLEATLNSAVMGDQGAIKKLASALKARPSAVTPDVLQQVDQRISFRTELAQLESEQRDILDDPHLGKLFNLRLNELAREDAKTPLAKAYRSVGEELRKAFPEKFKKPAIDPAKLARKATHVNAPSAAGRQSERPDEQDEDTIETVIDKMAKARGQPQAVRHAKH